MSKGHETGAGRGRGSDEGTEAQVAELHLERERISLEREKLEYERGRLSDERERVDALIEEQSRFRRRYVSPLIILLVAILFCGMGIGIGVRIGEFAGPETVYFESGSSILLEALSDPGRGDTGDFIEGWTNIAFSTDGMRGRAEPEEDSDEAFARRTLYHLLFE